MDVINILLATSEMEAEMAMFLLLKVQHSLRDHQHRLAKWGLRGQEHFPLCSKSPSSPPPQSSCGVWINMSLKGASITSWGLPGHSWSNKRDADATQMGET